MNAITTARGPRVRTLVTCVIVAVALVPAALKSQETWPLGTGVGLFGGFAKPIDENTGGAFAYGLNLSYALTKNLAVELSGFRFESAVEGSKDGLSKGKLAVIPVALSVLGRYPMNNGRLLPFVEAGVGYYLNNSSVDAAVVSDWADVGIDLQESVENVFGFHVGAGLDFFVARNISLGAAVKYSFATAKGTWSMKDVATGTVAGGDLKDLNVGPLAFGIRLKYVLR